MGRCIGWMGQAAGKGWLVERMGEYLIGWLGVGTGHMCGWGTALFDQLAGLVWPGWVGHMGN